MEQSGPSRFGPYVVIEQIGSGGMGAVYRARDERLGRDVAVKMLHRHVSVGGARERFLREARAASSLNHPNICTVFDIGEEDGNPYMVMEMLEGQSLQDRIVSADAVSQAELEAIALQAALALAAAHGKGIVHRDIKPANLFLVDNVAGEVHLKVLDFGLAKIESDRLLHGDSGLTRTGATVGTVEYMSPEQARGEPLDPRSDLFSLGAILYELATGEAPFGGATSAVIFAALLGSAPAPARSSNPNLSPGMDDIIRRLLDKRLHARVQSANELIVALRRLHVLAAPAPINTVNAPLADEAIAPARRQQDSRVADPRARALRPAAPTGVRLTSPHIGVEEFDDESASAEQRSYAPASDAQQRHPMKQLLIVLLVLLVMLLAVGGYFVFKRST